MDMGFHIPNRYIPIYPTWADVLLATTPKGAKVKGRVVEIIRACTENGVTKLFVSFITLIPLYSVRHHLHYDMALSFPSCNVAPC
jgi:fumarate reductase subunit D